MAGGGGEKWPDSEHILKGQMTEVSPGWSQFLRAIKESPQAQTAHEGQTRIQTQLIYSTNTY